MRFCERPAIIHVLTQNKVVEHETPTTEVIDVSRTRRLLLRRRAFLEHVRVPIALAQSANTMKSVMCTGGGY